MLFSLDLYPSLKIQLQHLKNDATPVIYVNSNDVIIIRPYANVKNLWLVQHPINFMYFGQRKDHIVKHTFKFRSLRIFCKDSLFRM